MNDKEEARRIGEKSETCVMVIELRNIENNNRAECEQLSVSNEQKQYIASNAESLAAAKDNIDVARPF